MNRVEDELLVQAVDSVDGTRTLQEALNALVGALQLPLELWHATIALLEQGRPTVRLLANWSVVESIFEENMEVSTSISSVVAEAAALLEQGQVVRIPVARGDASLIDDLLREQGVAVVLSIPLHRAHGGTLVLSLGSSSEKVLGAVDISFCRDLAAGIGERLFALARTPSD